MISGRGDLAPAQSVPSGGTTRENPRRDAGTVDLTLGHDARNFRLPRVLAIGFTGHRKLPDERKSRAAILEFLQEEKARTAGIVYGVCSAAAGGDLLFAESCLELNLPLQVILPFSKDQFRDDFDTATWRRVERVLSQALDVRVISGNQGRNEAYYECGIETVNLSSVLLALWDGEPSQGIGGTKDIVSFAQEQDRPVVWIHSVTGELRRFNFDRPVLSDPELDFLEGLPDPAPELPLITAYDVAQAWFVKIDANASRLAPQYRRLAAIPIFGTAAAAVFTGASSLSRSGSPWLLIGTCLGIMAVLLPLAMKLQQRQIMWSRIRTAAEVCRSFLALWCAPTPYTVIGADAVPELSGMLLSLNFLKLSCRSDSVSPEKFAIQYHENRVCDQISYFSSHANKSARELHWYQLSIYMCVALALAVDVVAFVAARSPALAAWLSWKPALSLTGAILFQIAAVLGALVVVNDCRRRRQRYQELQALLEKWDKQIQLSLTWSTLLRTVYLVEKALLTELIEWRSLIRNRRVQK